MSINPKSEKSTFDADTESNSDFGKLQLPSQKTQSTNQVSVAGFGNLFDRACTGWQQLYPVTKRDSGRLQQLVQKVRAKNLSGSLKQKIFETARQVKSQ